MFICFAWWYIICVFSSCRLMYIRYTYCSVIWWWLLGWHRHRFTCVFLPTGSPSSYLAFRDVALNESWFSCGGRYHLHRKRKRRRTICPRLSANSWRFFWDTSRFPGGTSSWTVRLRRVQVRKEPQAHMPFSIARNRCYPLGWPCSNFTVERSYGFSWGHITSAQL